MEQGLQLHKLSKHESSSRIGYDVLKKLTCLILLLAFTSACAPSRALIQSEPPGAMVIMDGKELGVTPVNYTHKLSSGQQHNISLKHQGFESVAMTITADKTDTPALKRWLKAGVVWSPLWIGALFTKKLKENYMFVMKRSQPQMTASLGADVQK